VIECTFLVSFWVQVISFYSTFEGMLPHGINVELNKGQDISAGALVTVMGSQCGAVKNVSDSIAYLQVSRACLAPLEGKFGALIRFSEKNSVATGLELVPLFTKRVAQSETIRTYRTFEELWKKDR